MTDRRTRRTFLATTASGMAAGLANTTLSASAAATQRRTARSFRVWAMSCAHVGTDLRAGKRESLAEAIRHAEQGGDQGGPPFDFDIALHLGDLSGNQGPPTDEEGQEVVRQFAATRRHTREHFYNVLGNHDASGQHESTQWWFRKWVDPTGEQPEFSGVRVKRRPYPVSGTWERYSFRAGNLLFLMMGDRNDGGPPVGRGPRGGYPAGAVSGDTYQWWQRQVTENPDSVIISAHHHMLKETTVASGPYEGFEKRDDGTWRPHYHGYFADGGPEGASYLYFVDKRPDAQAFESYLATHGGAIDIWLGGHTHTHPDDRKGGRSHIERKWGVEFINVAALTRYHGRRTAVPMSRLLTFTEGSRQVRVQCYLHTSQFAPQGWYAKAEKTIELKRPFDLSS